MNAYKQMKALRDIVAREMQLAEKRIDRLDDRIANLEAGNPDKRGKTLEQLERKQDTIYDQLAIWERIWPYVKDAE